MKTTKKYSERAVFMNKFAFAQFAIMSFLLTFSILASKACENSKDIGIAMFVITAMYTFFATMTKFKAMDTVDRALNKVANCSLFVSVVLFIATFILSTR